jgi:carbon storage regulator CsrA
MLVLTRKLQEKIRIGDDITITILRTKGKAIRLGIEAPMEVPVIRGELIFDDTRKESIAEEVEEQGTVADAIGAEAGRNVAQTARTMPRWETKTQFVSADRPPGSHRVSLQRVPRAQAGQAPVSPPSPVPCERCSIVAL